MYLSVTIADAIFVTTGIWQIVFDGKSTRPPIAPENLAFGFVSAATLGDRGPKNKREITPYAPILLLALFRQSSENTTLRAFDGMTFADTPERVADYTYVQLLYAVFMTEKPEL
jgi:hypothetical protein